MTFFEFIYLLGLKTPHYDMLYSFNKNATIYNIPLILQNTPFSLCNNFNFKENTSYVHSQWNLYLTKYLTNFENSEFKFSKHLLNSYPLLNNLFFIENNFIKKKF